ncbi:MAG: alanine racemase, partial [Acidovorax sp.]|nr:alanine racemase [Acidovorax sp.]
MNATYDGPRLALDFDALAHNWRTVCAAGMGQPVGAVVKNDAYGLGVAAVVPRLWALGCREFWVATLHEAQAVRHSLRDTAAGAARILVLNGLAGACPEDFAAQGLTPVLTGPHELAPLADYAARTGARLPVAVHLDTGLTRLGFGAAQLPALQPQGALWRDAQVTHWVTHLGRFHDPEAPQCLLQRERFVQWTRQLPPALRSIATSSSVFAGPGWHFDHARVGSALWGVPASQRTTPALRPVASLHAPVLRVADVPAGTEVGYAGSYTTPGPRRIATVALGYGDGLPFSLVNRGHLVLAGRHVPIVGGVAMGMVAVDVS